MKAELDCATLWVCFAYISCLAAREQTSAAQIAKAYLITMHISDCCQFSDIHISQGSVATCLRCGRIFKYEFVANLPVSLPVKEF